MPLRAFPPTKGRWMNTRNALAKAPPFDIEMTLKKLGGHLRKARIRRQLTIAQVAQKIGTGVRSVSDAESGKLTSGIGTYAALLWAYGLLGDLQKVADPLSDAEGLALAGHREGERSRRRKRLDNDF